MMAEPLTRRQTVAWAMKMQLDNSSNGVFINAVASGKMLMGASSVKQVYSSICAAAFVNAGAITPQEQLDALGQAGGAAFALSMRQPQSTQLGRAIAAGLVAQTAADYAGPPPAPEVTPPPPIGDDGTPIDPGTNSTEEVSDDGTGAEA